MQKVDIKKVPLQNLEAVIIGNATTTDKARCKVELDRRNWWRDFWTKGIVAWIALLIALASLTWQILKEVWR